MLLETVESKESRIQKVSSFFKGIRGQLNDQLYLLEGSHLIGKWDDHVELPIYYIVMCRRADKYGTLYNVPVIEKFKLFVSADQILRLNFDKPLFNAKFNRKYLGKGSVTVGLAVLDEIVEENASDRIRCLINKYGAENIFINDETPNYVL